MSLLAGIVTGTGDCIKTSTTDNHRSVTDIQFAQPGLRSHRTESVWLWPDIDLLFILDACQQKLERNNIFTVAKRNVEGKDMLYQTMKLTNSIWVLAELKIHPEQQTFAVSF